MSIRFKLLISNILMILIPLISSVVLAIVLIGVGLDKSDFNDNKADQSFKRKHRIRSRNLSPYRMTPLRAPINSEILNILRILTLN
jgi:hypothetical protein